MHSKANVHQNLHQGVLQATLYQWDDKTAHEDVQQVNSTISHIPQNDIRRSVPGLQTAGCKEF